MEVTVEATETVKAVGADINKIAAFAEAKLEEKKEPQKGEKTKKAKAEESPPTPEEIVSAVAGVVLAEMKHWSEEVVALVGKQHPNKESFLKGVPYVIGAYMHFARSALETRRAMRKREAELKTVKLLGPVAVELQELQRLRMESITQSVKDLEKERKDRLQAAKTEINREFDAKIAEVTGAEPSEEILKLTANKALIEEAYEGACGRIDVEAEGLLEQIRAIDETKDDWNSKSRKARRSEEKETPQSAQETVE